MEALNKGHVIDLHRTYFAGIRKTLFYVMGSNELAWVSVEDNQGENFCVEIPPKAEMPADRNPMWYFTHAMLFGPETNGRGNIYAAPGE